MMNPTRRAHGDSHYFTADGKRFFIVGEPLKADKLPMPTHAQMQTAVLPEDIRWKPSRIRRLALNPITFLIAITLGIGALVFVLVNL